MPNSKNIQNIGNFSSLRQHEILKPDNYVVKNQHQQDQRRYNSKIDHYEPLNKNQECSEHKLHSYADSEVHNCKNPYIN